MAIEDYTDRYLGEGGGLAPAEDIKTYKCHHYNKSLILTPEGLGGATFSMTSVFTRKNRMYGVTPKWLGTMDKKTVGFNKDFPDEGTLGEAGDLADVDGLEDLKWGPYSYKIQLASDSEWDWLPAGTIGDLSTVPVLQPKDWRELMEEEKILLRPREKGGIMSSGSFRPRERGPRFKPHPNETVARAASRIQDMGMPGEAKQLYSVEIQHTCEEILWLGVSWRNSPRDSFTIKESDWHPLENNDAVANMSLTAVEFLFILRSRNYGDFTVGRFGCNFQLPDRRHRHGPIPILERAVT